jgi:outer membrane immunogenic protein
MRHSSIAVIAGISTVAFVQIASAADLPRKAPPPAPPPPPVYSWTGCYIGGNVGGVWSRFSDTWTANPAGFGGPTFINQSGTHTEDGSGVTAGGQVGCQRQFAQVVVGVEGDISYTDLSASRDLTTSNLGATQIYHSDFSSHWLATFRGRLGWLVSPSVLIYGTGGFAFANVDTTDSVFFAASASTDSASGSTTRVGWTAGGGIEWMFLPKWSVKVEYLYADLGPSTNISVNPNPLFPLATISNSHRLTENIARVGLNYKFY